MIDQPDRKDPLEDNFLTAAVTMVCGVFGICVLGWTAWKVAPDDAALATNYLIVLLGFILGWTTGMYLSPYSAAEASKFVTVGQAISAFLSGYALAKLDRFVESTLFVQNKLPVYEHWIRLGIFVAAFFIACILVFTARAYFRIEDERATGKRRRSAVKRVEDDPGELNSPSRRQRP